MPLHGSLFRESANWWIYAASTMLVDCSRSFCTNYVSLLAGPGIEIATAPRPLEGMRKPTIVFGPTGLQMVNQIRARVRIKARHIFIRKGPQQQLRLIQPAGVRRRIERPQAWMTGQVDLGCVGDVR